MQKIISTEGLPIKLWLDEVEEGAVKQAVNLANLPFAFSHICLMPDIDWRCLWRGQGSTTVSYRKRLPFCYRIFFR